MCEKIKCEDCKSTNIFVDYKNAEIVCRDCGFVQTKFVVKDEIYEQ